jgi:branched-chain amino acid aminotransferase
LHDFATPTTRIRHRVDLAYGRGHFQGGRWSAGEIKPVAPIELSPAAHVLHYASTCFEGFKAFRRADGSMHIYRMDQHIKRMLQSARQLVLPEPDPVQLADMVRAVIKRCSDAVPEAPGALYLRPILFGTTANIGAAATPTADASLIVLASPVWDYFAGGMKPLRILVDDENTRSAAQMGMVKTGGNYAAALGPTLRARAKYQVDQVLFCPGGQVQETGAANFLLIRDGKVLTRSLDSTFLHGVTRDSLLTLARDLGYDVVRAALRREGNARVGEDGRGRPVGDGGGARRRGHPDLQGQEHRVARRRGGTHHARAARQAGGHSAG